MLPGPMMTASAMSPSVSSPNGRRRVSFVHVHDRVGSEIARALQAERYAIEPDHLRRAGMTGEHDVQLAHDAEADHDHSFAAPKPGTPHRFDGARQGLDQRRVRERDAVREPQRVGADLPRGHREVFRHPAGHELASAPCLALHVLAACTETARETRRMVMHEDAITRAKLRDVATDRRDLTCRLVAEDERRLPTHVPPHDVTGADPAGARAHQDLAGPDRWHVHLGDADLEILVEAGGTHGAGDHGKTGRRDAKVSRFTRLAARART